MPCGWIPAPKDFRSGVQRLFVAYAVFGGVTSRLFGTILASQFPRCESHSQERSRTHFKFAAVKIRRSEI